ncbi:hypothetical protein FFI16_016625 [Pseudomonas sp. KBS0710]|nr:hypothetical protein FFI16_016625 [Pseudomonas sp. KBS0710]
MIMTIGSSTTSVVTSPSPRFTDLDGNGKIDIEVDFDGPQGQHFSSLGNIGYQGLNAVQQYELRFQMNKVSNDVNLVFHRKGEIDNPDGKIKFGTFQQNTSHTNDVVVRAPSDSSEPVEVYFNGNETEDPSIAEPDGFNKGGHTLTRALLYGLGVTPPKPEEEGGTRDSLGYSALSLKPETKTGHDFKGATVTSAQIDDQEQLESLYGRNAGAKPPYEINQLGNEGYGATTSISSGPGLSTHETIDASGDTNNQTIDMRPGSFSSVKGYKKNVSITSTTVVEDVKVGSGNNIITPNAVSNQITLGAGNNTVVYHNLWDSSPDRPDTIIGFKTGKDKLDLSQLPPRAGQDPNDHSNGIGVSFTEDGTYVARSRIIGPEGTHEGPWDFRVRVDGLQPSDIITWNAD